MEDRKIIEGLVEELENLIFEEDEEEIEEAVKEIETDWLYRGITETLIKKAIEKFFEEYEIDN